MQINSSQQVVMQENVPPVKHLLLYCEVRLHDCYSGIQKNL